jgi:lipopolysaccharide export system protein LptA
MPILRYLALVLGLAAAMDVQALREDRNQPIRISAKTVTVDQKAGITRYQGDVVMHQGSLRINADRVVIRYEQGEIQSLSASGNPVSFRQRPDNEDQDIKATAARLQYSASDQTLHLYDSVALHRGDDILHSAVLHYDLGNSRLQAEGDPQDRVYSIIQPRKPAQGRP